MSRPVDMSPAAITQRLRQAAASELRPTARLDAKIGYGPAEVTRRLRRVSQMRDLCLRLASLSPGARPPVPNRGEGSSPHTSSLYC